MKPFVRATTTADREELVWPDLSGNGHDAVRTLPPRKEPFWGSYHFAPDNAQMFDSASGARLPFLPSWVPGPFTRTPLPKHIEGYWMPPEFPPYSPSEAPAAAPPPTDRECQDCHRQCDVGVACWWCGAKPK